MAPADVLTVRAATDPNLTTLPGPKPPPETVTGVPPDDGPEMGLTADTLGGPEGGGAPPAGPPPTPSAGDAVTLAASSLSPPVGAPVVLTATASRDVGPTPYGISIFDTTAGAELVHAGTGSSLAASVSRAAAATHSYVAKICNPGGVNAQASSVTVSVTWS